MLKGLPGMDTITTLCFSAGEQTLTWCRANEPDALLSVRPYKHAWNFKDALEHLRHERGRHFDPDCIDAILEIQKKFADEPAAPVSDIHPLRRGVA
jgi:hypothetical protein